MKRTLHAQSPCCADNSFIGFVTVIVLELTDSFDCMMWFSF